MKKITYMFCAIAASALLGGCAADNDFPAREGQIRMSVNVNRPKLNDALTRITIEEQEGDIVCNWKAGDRLLVTDATGTNIGYLELAAGQEGKNFAEFDGYLTGLKEGETTLNFFYLGQDTNVADYESTTHDANHSSQNGTLADLPKHDILTSQVTVNVADGWAYAPDLGLTRQGAFGHFELIMPEGVNLTNENVTISGTGVHSNMCTNLANLNIENTAGTITVPANNGHFYINLIPANGMNPTFTVTVAGKEYEGSLNPKDILPSMFLRKAHQQGVAVQMFAKAGEVDHSLNPLAKWAESNLVYDASTMTSRETGVALTPGSLYQWGRNVGFTDYKNAMGTYNSTSGAYNYGTYAKSYFAGEGFDPADVSYSIASVRYQTLAQLTGAGRKLFCIGDCSIASSGEGITGNGDYWQFEGGEGDWNARAQAGGYTPLAPEGYRLPTKADFMKIFPKAGINTGLYDLASTLDNLIELRDLEGGHKYAIRWTLEGTGRRDIRIQCLMVTDDFSESALNTIDWTANEVVTRYFPATGAIEGFTHRHINSQYKTLDVVRPMPWGTWSTQLNTYPSATNPAYWSVTYTNIVDAARTYEGAYWCADEYNSSKKLMFRFRDNQGAFGMYNTNSLFGASEQPAQNAFAVRCIKID